MIRSLQKIALHEIGHTMGLLDNYFAPSQESVMNQQSGTNDNGNNIATNVTNCVTKLYRYTNRWRESRRKAGPETSQLESILTQLDPLSA